MSRSGRGRWKCSQDERIVDPVQLSRGETPPAGKSRSGGISELYPQLAPRNWSAVRIRAGIGPDSPVESRASILSASQAFTIASMPQVENVFCLACRSEEHTSELQSLRHLVC